MPSETSIGKCELCGRSFRRTGMLPHLRSCLARQAGAGNDNDAGVATARGMHLVVGDVYRSGEYWLHLFVPAGATLEQLDDYLRSVWLECCDHSSCFCIGQVCYYRNFTDECEDEDEDDESDGVDFGDEDGDEDDDGVGDWLAMPPHAPDLISDDMDMDMDMDVAVATAAPPGTRFHHEYDFGTTTRLKLRSAAEIAVPTEFAVDNAEGAGGICLLARNDAPEVLCDLCGSPATYLQQILNDFGIMSAGVCDVYASRLDEDELLPIINSPRSGLCGYTGPPRTIFGLRTKTRPSRWRRCAEPARMPPAIIRAR